MSGLAAAQFSGILAEIAPDRSYLTEWVLVGVGFALLIGVLITVLYTTRAGIIARATTKEAIRQPVFLVLMALALVMLVANTFIPFFTLGEDDKIFKECGMATLLIGGLLLSIWTASTSIADEIEGKTAITLLSKPINRRQFILGKYLGILSAVLLFLAPLTAAFYGLGFYKMYAYDARESPRQVDLTVNEALIDTAVIFPGIALDFMEIAVLAAISVAISTRLPMVVNMVTCLTIFIVGHLTASLVAAGVVKNELVLFMARMIASVVPQLDVYNIETAFVTGASIPPTYIALAAAYSAAYAAIAVLMAFILFEDRDLA